MLYSGLLLTILSIVTSRLMVTFCVIAALFSPIGPGNRVIRKGLKEEDLKMPPLSYVYHLRKGVDIFRCDTQKSFAKAKGG